MVCLLVESGASVDARDEQLDTPLLLAAESGHTATAVYLASRGADVEAEDRDGQTPLGAAAAHGRLRDLLVDVVAGRLDVEEFLSDA